jgi:uncharacterized membrane protein
MNLQKNRNSNIDILRGFAIIIMIIAHLAPHVYSNDIQGFFGFRFICSIAAPIFLFILGYGLKNFSNFEKKKYFIKGVFILVNACLIDVFLWNIIPFYSFDILYIIGFSILFYPFWSKIAFKYLIIICCFLYFSTLIIDWLNIYTLKITEINFNQISDFKFETLIYNLVVNGWFPFFPWFGFIIYGYVFDEIRLFDKRFYQSIFFLITLFLSLYNLQNSFNYNREFAVELFYPANIYYFTSAISIVTLIKFYFLDRNKIQVNILSTIGKVSLFMYSFHLVMITLFFNLVYTFCRENFIITCLVFIIFCVIISYILNVIKKKYNFHNIFLKILFGT